MSDVIKGVEYAAKFHLDEKKKAEKEGRVFKGSGANMSLGGGKSPTLDSAVNGVSI
jgi:cerevisin